jgi:4-carboxymuconolactone decarboxylase
MARLELPTDAQMTDDQRASIAEAVAGRRGRMPVPMIAWVRNAELARRAQLLGEQVRFGTSLERRLSELAVLVCARHWAMHYEWSLHKQEAVKAGLDPKIVEAIAAQRAPSLEGAEEQAVYDVAIALLSSRRLPQQLYDRALATLGELRLVELVAILGYYSLVALTLNAFELGLPASFAPELEEAR